MKIIKNSGDIVDYVKAKLRRSLQPSGVPPSDLDRILKTIEAYLYDGIRTRQIHKFAKRLLKKTAGSHAARYNLRSALEQLGPAGFFFEKFIALLLESEGHETKTNQVLPGKCVSHEINIITLKAGQLAMVECKFHARAGAVSDVKVPMYILSRSTTATTTGFSRRGKESNDAMLELEIYINNTIDKGGSVIIPGFAVERAQSVMYLLWRLKKENRIPEVPCILDTPMGISVLDIFRNNKKWHKLSFEQCTEMCDIFTMISDYKDTVKGICDPRPKIVVAASGMLTGGRVLSYLERYIGLESTTVIIVGYQAEGTRGRKLLDGADEIKIHGKYHGVKAKILEIKGLSAHADQSELLDWISELERKPKKIFLLHGENTAADELRVKIRERYGYDCSVAAMGKIIEI